MRIQVLLVLSIQLFTRQTVALSVPANTKPTEAAFKPEYANKCHLLSASRITELLPPTNQNQGDDGTGTQPLRQQLFTSPLVSVLYERVLPPLWEVTGLRLGGPEAEYRAAAQYLETANANDNASHKDGRIGLDLSCGTGFVGIRMAASGYFDHVFALDYSEQMLRECVNTVRREAPKQQQQQQENMLLPLSVIRGDAGNLPFQDHSLDAIHWGAAMHCVPRAEQALQEVYRVLKPGGRLYATTFLRPFPDVVFRFFTVKELRSMTVGAGFPPSSVSVTKKGVYGIIQAQK